MRPLTPQQDRIRQLTQPNYAVYWRVQVGRSSDATEFVNLHDFLGYDLLTSVGITESIDNNVVTADFSVTSRIGEVRLSPLVNGSVVAIGPGGALDPLFEPGNRVRIFAAVAIPGQDPDESEYLQLFEGFLDRVNTSPNSITVECRDQSAPLLNDYVEEVTRYGSDAGDPVENVMQDIITDHVPAARAPTFLAPVSPNFNILTYAQRKEPVYSALRKLAQQIGWDIRFRANDITNPQLPVSEDLQWFPRGFIFAANDPPDEENWIDTGIPLTASGTNRLLLLALTSVSIDSGGFGTALLAPVSAVRVNTDNPMTRLMSVNYIDEFDITIEHSVWYLDEAGLQGVMGSLSFGVTVGNFVSQLYGSVTNLNNVDQSVPFGPFGGSAGLGGLPRTVDNLTHADGDMLFGAAFDIPTLSSSNPTGLIRDAADRTAGGNQFLTSANSATVSLDSTAGIVPNALIAGVVKGIQGGTLPTSFDLTLYEPDRTKTDPDDVISPDLVLDHGGISVDNYTIRNKIRVVFVDAATQARTEIVVQDTASQARYGIRFMEIVEGTTSNIDTLVEAQRMADAVLADLKEPLAKMRATLPFRPWIQIGDLLRFKANDEEWAVDLDLAVQSYKHRVSSKGTVVTEVNVEGKPSSGWKRWFDLEARPGVGDDANTVPPATPTGVTVQSELGGLRVEFDQPTDINYDFTEIYLSKVPGFTPSADTYQGFARTNQFTIGGLTVGDTYYVVIIHVDNQGNKSAPTTQVLTVAEFVGPRHRDIETPFYSSVNENFNFSIFTKGTDVFPDAWGFQGRDAGGLIVPPPAWIAAGNDSYYFDNAFARNGAYSLRYNGTSNPANVTPFYSDLAPVTGGAFLGCEYTARMTSGQNTVNIGIVFYTQNRVALGGLQDFILTPSQLNQTSGPPSNVTLVGSGYIFAPAGAAYAQLAIRPEPAPGATSPIAPLFVDSCRLFTGLVRMSYRLDPPFLTTLTTDAYLPINIGSLVTGTISEDNTQSLTYVPGGGVANGSVQYVIPKDGFYTVSFTAGTQTALPAGETLSVRIREVTSNQVLIESASPPAGDQATASAQLFLNDGDILAFEGKTTVPGIGQLWDKPRIIYQVQEFGEIK